MRVRAAALSVCLLQLAPLSAGLAQDDERTPVERGAYLVRAGGCITCHSAEGDDAPLAGGRALETRFGTFRTPNITPDSRTGIGEWSEAEFVRALRHGISPANQPYYPSFPYPSYRGMTRPDAQALYAYLQSIEPVTREVKSHDLDFPYNFRILLWPWRWLFLESGSYEPDPERSSRWNRGAYLVRHLGHCGECHTPRNWAGAKIEARHLAGNPDGPQGKSVPNITPHEESGIGDWSRIDLTFFLETGFKPSGDVAGGGMGAVVRDSTGQLSGSDRQAIAEYLRSLQPLPSAAGGS